MSRKKARNPESEEYDKLKGEMIRLWPSEDWKAPPVICQLLWVADHTLGVAFHEGTQKTKAMIFKTGGMRIERLRDHED